VERKYCTIPVASVDPNMLQPYVLMLPLILQPFAGSHHHQHHYHPYHPYHYAELGFLACSLLIPDTDRQRWNYVMSDFEVSEIF
jgi:hypothetical protein